jgi:hypothetical protein
VPDLRTLRSCCSKLWFWPLNYILLKDIILFSFLVFWCSAWSKGHLLSPLWCYILLKKRSFKFVTSYKARSASPNITLPIKRLLLLFYISSRYKIYIRQKNNNL